MENYYSVLGVKEDATTKEIKTSYMTLIKKYHPDVYGGDKIFSEKITSKVNMAYSILGKELKRSAYDRKLRAQRESQEAKKQKPSIKKKVEIVKAKIKNKELNFNTFKNLQHETTSTFSKLEVIMLQILIAVFTGIASWLLYMYLIN